MPTKTDTITFNTIDARTVRITGATKSIRVNKLDNEIVSLELPSTILTKGHNLIIRNEPYKMNIIKKVIMNNVLFFEAYVAQKTKSSLLIMPMLDGNKNLYFYDSLLMNCFLGTKDESSGVIGLLYRWSNSPVFLKFEKAVQQFRNFVKIVDFSKHFVYFEFNVPKKYIKDYNKFINGKYSELSSNYKDKILKFHEIDIESQIAQILYKGKKRKKRLEHSLGINLDPDAELFSIINEDLEYFDKNYYL
jgi:hypothetical protein